MKRTLLLLLLTTALALPLAVNVETADARIECKCIDLQTQPVTRVGATCLRARQRAAAAARELAVCGPGSTGKCGPTTHTVAPCQALSTGGFSATATAFFSCEFCFDNCPDIPEE